VFNFDPIPHSPTATSLANLNDWQTYLLSGGGTPLDIQLNGLNYQTLLGDKTWMLASQDPTITQGEAAQWHYQTPDAQWHQAESEAAASQFGEQALLYKYLSYASRLIDGLTEICGPLDYECTRYFTGALTAHPTEKMFIAQPEDNAFLWLEHAVSNKITITNLGLVSGLYTVSNIEHTADAHQLSVEETIPALFFSPQAQLSFRFKTQLSIPRAGDTVPSGIKQAVCALAQDLMRHGETLSNPSGVAEISSISVDEEFSANYKIRKDGTQSADKPWLSDTVLQLLQPYLCHPIRGVQAQAGSTWEVFYEGQSSAQQLNPFTQDTTHPLLPHHQNAQPPKPKRFTCYKGK